MGRCRRGLSTDVFARGFGFPCLSRKNACYHSLDIRSIFFGKNVFVNDEAVSLVHLNQNPWYFYSFFLQYVFSVYLGHEFAKPSETSEGKVDENRRFRHRSLLVSAIKLVPERQQYKRLVRDGRGTMLTIDSICCALTLLADARKYRHQSSYFWLRHTGVKRVDMGRPFSLLKKRFVGEVWNFLKRLTASEHNNGWCTSAVAWPRKFLEKYRPRGVCFTVRYGTVRYGTVRYGTVRYGTVRYGMVLYPPPIYTDGNVPGMLVCNAPDLINSH